MKKISLLVFAIFCSACSENDLPKYVELKGLRILGLVASTPEVDPGANVTVTPIISDITESTSLSYEATGCIAINGFETSCVGNPTAAALGSGTLNSGDMTAARGFTGLATAINVNIPAAGIIFAQRSAQDQFNGVTYLVTYEIRNTAGAKVQSLKRLIVSTRPGGEKNQNPVLSDILGNNTAFNTTYPTGQSVSLTPVFGSPAAESYRVQTDSGEFRSEAEELITTWFITDGEVKYFRSVSTEANTYTAAGTDPASAGRDFYLLAVTRDGRGGLAFVRKCFGNCL